MADSGGSRSSVSLCGMPLRFESVRLLASRLEGDELAEKLERAVAHRNTIVALSFEERQRIVDVLASTPGTLPDLRLALDAQVRKRREQEGKMQRASRDRGMFELRHGSARGGQARTP